MPRFARRFRTPLVALLFLAALPVFEARAQGIDFGAPAGEDVLIGESPVAVSGGERLVRRSWREDSRRGWRDGDWGHGWRSPSPRDADGRQGRRWSAGSSPSVIVIDRLPPRSTYTLGTGVFANAQGRSGGGFVADGGVMDAPRGIPGPRIIDVDAERLDRQPIGAGGVSVTYVGSAKIIRIAAGYGRRSAGATTPAPEKDMAALPVPAGEPAAEPRPAAPRPSTAPRAAPAEEPAPTSPAPSAEAAPRLEPWTDEWLADCVARHEDFDATLGTYTAEDGRRRFCTGEPS